jgi:radical SAM protein with 4Fe4S-binding SPASM domain
MSCCGDLIPGGERDTLNVQFQLTTVCPHSCKHCYIAPGDIGSMPLERCKGIIDDVKEAMKELNKKGRMVFAGGDPLIYPHLFEVLEYARSQIPEVVFHLLGNPELLSDDVIRRLKELNLYSYQMSLEGLEDTHDYIRHKGSFREIMEKVDLLKKHQMRVVIRSTVSGLNMDDIPDLFDLMIERGVDVFSIHRFIPVKVREYTKDLTLIPPREYKEFLLRIYGKYMQHEESSCEVVMKEPLWRLVESEMGLNGGKKWVWNDCRVGERFCVLKTGEALICRMLLIPVGRFPEQKIIDVYNSSPVLEEMKRLEKLEECGECELRDSCGGCRALAYIVHGSYFAPDPYCWKIPSKGTRKYAISLRMEDGRMDGRKNRGA